MAPKIRGIGGKRMLSSSRTVDAFFGKCQAYCMARDGGALANLVDSLPIEESDLSHRQRYLLDECRAHAYRHTQDWKRSLLYYRKVLLSGNLTVATRVYLLADAAFVYNALVAYDTSLALYKKALELCREHLKNESLIATLTSSCRVVEWNTMVFPCAGTPGINQQRICNECGEVGPEPSLLICSCQRVWYCNARCMSLNEVSHHRSRFHFRINLDLIPKDVIRKHILPWCLIPCEEDRKAAALSKAGLNAAMVAVRKRFLALRTLNKNWMAHVDACKLFWTSVMPCDWTPYYKQDTEALDAMPHAEMREHIFRWTGYFRNHVIDTKMKEHEKGITKVNGSIERLKRQLEEKEAEKADLESEVLLLVEHRKKPRPRSCVEVASDADDAD